MMMSLPWSYTCRYCGRIFNTKQEAEACINQRPHEKKRCEKCGKEHEFIADLLECCEEEGMSEKKRLVVWFSCGAASAVTAKLCLAKYADSHEIAIARCVVANEHPDNDRFAAECEQWFGRSIINLTNPDYKDCWELWETHRYLVDQYGAPCTVHLKKRVRFLFEQEWSPDIQAFGYTSEEARRANRFRQNNPKVKLITPLIEDDLKKADCLAMINRAGIEIPAMYRLGFNNNNCIGCVKGGMGYWNRIRNIFPDVFNRMAKLERELGHSINRQNGLPVFLDELDPDSGRHDEPEIDCSLFCYRAEQFYTTFDQR